MSIRREYLDWNQPALMSVAERLEDRYRVGDEWNLEEVVVVVPGSRAGRQLLEVLVRRAEAHQLRLIPPRIETMGHLPELLYQNKHPFAVDLIQQLTWVKALRQVGPEKVGAALAELPMDGAGGRTADWPRWLELAKVIWRLHRELAAEVLDFKEVAMRVEPLADGERPRWELLAAVQEAYHRELDKYELWDQQTARLVAIRDHECRALQDIILVAVADMNKTVQTMLDQVADRVTAWVHAPASLADRFDSHGCLIAERWLDAHLPLDEVTMLIAEGPAEQAETVAGVVAEWAREFTESEIVVATPDERLVPFIERQLEDCGVGVHRGTGVPLRTSRPFRLLDAVARYLQRPRFREFASLVRHPDVYGWLVEHSPGFELHELDQYAAQHLPPGLGEWLGPSEGRSRKLQDVESAIRGWLAPVTGPAKGLGAWPEAIAEILRTVYGDVKVDRRTLTGQRQWLSCQSIHACLGLLSGIPTELSPELSAADALHIVLDQLREQATPVARQPDDLEILGWLELPLDLAPGLIVTSFNEGFVPTSVNADQFLPNNLRRRLSLLDNQRRYARDAYALHLLAQTRRRLALVVGRRDAAGDPLIPSRLAFAADELTIAQRVLRLMGHDDPEPSTASADASDESSYPVTSHHEWSHAPGACDAAGVENTRSEYPMTVTASVARETGFQIPRPEPRSIPLTTLPVTAFRAYLNCPYRFYLQYVLRLEAETDRATELDASQFGVLLHGVLAEFAAGPCRDATDEAVIREFLRDALASLATEQFGTHRLAPVNLQLGQLKARLNGFARWQAERAREGWRIRHQEESCEATPSFLKFGRQQVAIRGRIDRIDYHEQLDQWAVLDYKSSDSPKTPRQAHFRAGEWVDLQLPLYRHLAASLNIPSHAQLGYVVLPKDTNKVGILLADWSAAEIQDADHRAAEVAQAILDQNFWPPSGQPPTFADDFAGICQDSVFLRGQKPDDSADDGGESD
jgi:ATP-dependent helicase/nuclease subunit B